MVVGTNEVLLQKNEQRALLKRSIKGSEQRKKAKLTPIKGKNIALPNELWFKIMNYLPTKDLFGTFALVNKKFYTLSLDPNAVKYLQLDDIVHHYDFEDHIKGIVRKYKHIVELSIFAIYGHREGPRTWQTIVEHFMKPGLYKKLKSLKVAVIDAIESVVGNAFDTDLTMHLWNKIERKNIEHFFWNGTGVRDDVMRKINQTKNLKTVRISHFRDLFNDPEIYDRYFDKTLEPHSSDEESEHFSSETEEENGDESEEESEVHETE